MKTLATVLAVTYGCLFLSSIFFYPRCKKKALSDLAKRLAKKLPFEEKEQ